MCRCAVRIDLERNAVEVVELSSRGAWTQEGVCIEKDFRLWPGHTLRVLKHSVNHP